MIIACEWNVIIAWMDTGTAVGLFGGAAAFLGLGTFALVMAIKGLLAAAQPDITVSAQGQQARIGRSGLLVFVVLGVLAIIVGIAILIAAIKGVA
jgi:hypothetical protein